ncbi:tail fiber protein [Tsukamurella phage TPA2]|uniref:tail fiber protein n=1 Tax=Tsukamurella phage TPA2 TaxID=981330 RepID=UPI0001FF8DC5|nr:tail fiber protein [Tsukamurella phage TPA2]ADX31960.1 putative tail fiber protein [Tsukamurella phage TPA2]
MADRLISIDTAEPEGQRFPVVVRAEILAVAGSVGQVTSVNGRSGAVTLSKTDVQLANVDNTSDASKPISTATQTALDGKAAVNHTHTKADIGLGNVDNTSDAAKPISTATQTALDGKAALSHTHTKAQVGLGNVDNTSDANKPVSTATQTALNAKVNTVDAVSAATAGKVVQRDANGRAQVVDPSVAADIATKGYVDSAIGSGGVADGGITTAKLADGAVTTVKVGDGQITAAKIATGAVVLPTRTITAGTGLSGGGTLAADRTLAVVYGTTAGTAAQGNDARLSDQRVPTDNSVTSAKIVDGTIVNADISASAAIDPTKLGTGRVTGSTNGTVASKVVWTGTAAQLAAVGTKDANTVYIAAG